MTTERAWEIRNGKADDVSIREQFDAWLMEFNRMTDLLLRNKLKSTADWIRFNDVAGQVLALRNELMTPAKAS